TFEGRDASNVPTQDFTVASAAGIVSLAQAIGPHVALGVAGKYVLDSQGPSEKSTGMTLDAGLSLQVRIVVLDSQGHSEKSTGMTLDAGLSLQFGMVGLGLAAQNAIGTMTYGDWRYPF